VEPFSLFLFFFMCCVEVYIQIPVKTKYSFKNFLHVFFFDMLKLNFNRLLFIFKDFFFSKSKSKCKFSNIFYFSI
jgi:hypothetical protein